MNTTLLTDKLHVFINNTRQFITKHKGLTLSLVIIVMMVFLIGSIPNKQTSNFLDTSDVDRVVISSFPSSHDYSKTIETEDGIETFLMEMNSLNFRDSNKEKDEYVGLSLTVRVYYKESDTVKFSIFDPYIIKADGTVLESTTKQISQLTNIIKDLY